MENKENTQPKFTPGPWEAGSNPAMATVLDDQEGKAIYQKGKGGCHHIGWANIHDDEGKLDMETALANAALIAAAPELYANEKTNLEVLKNLTVVYEEMENLVATDADVQNVLGPQVTVDVVHGIVIRLRQRIEATEKILAKARGEDENG